MSNRAKNANVNNANSQIQSAYKQSHRNFRQG